MATRRVLTFATLNDASTDAEHLLTVGYEKTGNWDLSQVCGHLANWMRYQMDGFPPVPLVMAPVFWVLRNTLGRRLVKSMTAVDGQMKTGMSTIPQSIPAPGGNEAAAVADLKATIAKYMAHDGPLHPSPLLGQLTKDQWIVVHRQHTAHHLSFLVPKA